MPVAKHSKQEIQNAFRSVIKNYIDHQTENLPGEGPFRQGVGGVFGGATKLSWQKNHEAHVWFQGEIVRFGLAVNLLDKALDKTCDQIKIAEKMYETILKPPNFSSLITTEGHAPGYVLTLLVPFGNEMQRVYTKFAWFPWVAEDGGRALNYTEREPNSRAFLISFHHSTKCKCSLC